MDYSRMRPGQGSAPDRSCGSQDGRAGIRGYGRFIGAVHRYDRDLFDNRLGSIVIRYLAEKV